MSCAIPFSAAISSLLSLSFNAWAEPIAPGGPAALDTDETLHAAVLAALAAAGVDAHESDDPGRYICNNVYYTALGAVADSARRALFVHLPYTTRFDDDERARWGRVVETVVQAVADDARR